MRQFSFATLITAPSGVPTATHLPVYLDDKRGEYGTLLAHMARANSQWRDFEAGGEALVIFQGPHSYISPSWYETHPSVPTWNYVAIHAYGKPRLIQDMGELQGMLGTLVNTYETGFEHPWQMDLPEDYMHNMMKAIVGFEIEITRLEGKFKLSQNRGEHDQWLVVQALKDSADPLIREVAELMGGKEAE
jgi:transcriptional regulator